MKEEVEEEGEGGGEGEREGEEREEEGGGGGGGGGEGRRGRVEERRRNNRGNGGWCPCEISALLHHVQTKQDADGKKHGESKRKVQALMAHVEMDGYMQQDVSALHDLQCSESWFFTAEN